MRDIETNNSRDMTKADVEKTFDGWNKVKKATHTRTDAGELFFYEREVWWCRLGVNVGFEQDGKGEHFQRPVVILKKLNQCDMFAVPLTTNIKKNQYFIPFVGPDGVKRAAITSQLRRLDVKRLTEKMFTVDESSFLHIKKAVNALLR